jgi:hypothetical protein
MGEEIQAEVDEWRVGALALQFRCAKAALLDDFDNLRQLIPAAVETGEISRSDLLSWPLFRSLRREALFVEVLAAVDDPGDDGGGGSPDLN